MDTAVDGIEIYAPQLTTLINVRGGYDAGPAYGVHAALLEPQQLNSSKQQLRVQQAALYPVVEVGACWCLLAGSPSGLVGGTTRVVQTTETIVGSMTSGSTGIPSVSSDLTAVTTSSNYPSSTTITTAADGGANSPSLQELLEGTSMVREGVAMRATEQCVELIGRCYRLVWRFQPIATRWFLR